jgi:hypothetical protein
MHRKDWTGTQRLVILSIGVVVLIASMSNKSPVPGAGQIRRQETALTTVLPDSMLGRVGMIRPLGLIISTYLVFLISILGSTEMRWIESLITAVAMTAFCWLLFVVLLNLPFQLWPRF